MAPVEACLHSVPLTDVSVKTEEDVASEPVAYPLSLDGERGPIEAPVSASKDGANGNGFDYTNGYGFGSGEVRFCL